MNILKKNFTEKPIEYKKIPHQSDFLPKIIKQQHIDGLIIKTGLATDRPDGSTHIGAYFSTDTLVLSIWTGSAWATTTLS